MRDLPSAKGIREGKKKLEATSMWKYLIALVAMLAVGTAGACDIKGCVDCYANIIEQTDTQTVKDVTFGTTVTTGYGGYGGGGSTTNKDPSATNEAISSAVIVTAAPGTERGKDGMFIDVAFGKIVQTMDQTIGSGDTALKCGDVALNKAAQAAWMQDQGRKEKEQSSGSGGYGGYSSSAQYEIEAGLITQDTKQIIKNVNYDGAGKTTVKNVDSKLAIMTDTLEDLLVTIESGSKTSTEATSSIDADDP
jgi:hypothetical protein